MASQDDCFVLACPLWGLLADELYYQRTLLVANRSSIVANRSSLTVGVLSAIPILSPHATITTVQTLFSPTLSISVPSWDMSHPFPTPYAN